ncbi:DUF5000 domain-containing lipoprotein [Anseongella ginsenosidimutans]|nr:DUF5000 domain-containing lipoprotein [Anseongella ginsenosidimutans]QEC51071.1 DUF4959 domain-containing protein [Anseongella ginsenosidimutans]
MKRAIFMFFTGLVIMAAGSCKEEEINNPVENDGSVPGPVSNVSVENLHGAARITYSLPRDKDLLYVKAEFESKPGVVRESRGSLYTNSVLVEGFGDTGTYDVKLYAVDRSENESEPVSIQINPLTPPVEEVFKSVTVTEDFGGANIKFENEFEAGIAVVVLTNDTVGGYVPVETFYTQLKEGSFSVRGYDTLERDFGVYVRDRWNNLSDTLRVVLSPLYETELDKGEFKEVRLPTDEPSAWGWVMPNLWNGDNGGTGFHTDNGGPSPQWFTFDLGVTAKLSRFKIWQRPDTWIFTHGNPREFELWGSNDPPSDGSWDNWVKLVECESVKPSGLPPASNTQDDVDAAARGEEYNVPIDAPEVRYIRFKTLRNWAGSGFVHFMEITFWGSPQQ